MSAATVKFEGSLTIQIASATAPCGVPADPGNANDIALIRSAANTYGQKLTTISSPASYVALLAAAAVGRLLWIRVVSGEGFEVRVTHAVAGAVVYPVKSILVLEPTDAEDITQVEVQGEGELEWALAGE